MADQVNEPQSLMEKIAEKINGHDASEKINGHAASEKINGHDASVKINGHAASEKINGHDASVKINGHAASENNGHAASEKINGHDSSSSSSDSEDYKSSPFDSAKSKIYRLFGREEPVHKVLGGGKPADIFLWRNKKISGGVLGVATTLWVFFEILEYHLITLVCHLLILSLAILFLWSNASAFINKSPPRIPEVGLPEHYVLEVASALRIEINRALAVLRDIAYGRDLKKFLGVIAGFWVLSVVGKWFNFMTLFYIIFVLLHTVPVLYEKYEDQVDPFAEKAIAEMKKQFAVFDEKVLSKFLKGPIKKD